MVLHKVFLGNALKIKFALTMYWKINNTCAAIQLMQCNICTCGPPLLLHDSLNCKHPQVHNQVCYCATLAVVPEKHYSKRIAL